MFSSVCVNHNTPVWVYCGPVCYADVSTVHCETRTVSTSTQCVCSHQYVWTTTPQSGFIVDLYATADVSTVPMGVTNTCLGLLVQKVNWPTMLLPSLRTRPFAPGGRVWTHAYIWVVPLSVILVWAIRFVDCKWGLTNSRVYLQASVLLVPWYDKCAILYYPQVFDIYF